METTEEARETDASTKAASQESLPKDDVKVNGDVNGSCDESSYQGVDEEDEDDGDEEAEDEEGNDSVADGDAAAAEVEEDVQHNGEARQNGVDDERMEVDGGEGAEGVVEPMDEDAQGDESRDATVESETKEEEEEDESNKNGEAGGKSHVLASGDASGTSDSEVMEVNRSKSVEKSDVKEKKEQDSGTVSIQKSLLSSIKGVDPSTPMSKELEDLSKIGARGSLEITLVKKDAQSDKAKEDAKEAKHKMEEDVLTITDASKRIIKPDKKNDEFDGAVIELSDKGSSPKKKKPPAAVPINVTPRRSSRNLNKSKTYTDKDMYIEDLDRKSDDEIEEVIPTDPLAEDKRKAKKTTIVVNDTKKLVEIAAGSKQNKGGKKEPTLVIIDTNSILSGKGAVPVSQTTLPQMSITPAIQKSSSQGFSPMMINSSSSQFVKSSSKSSNMQASQMAAAVSPKQPQVLPTLTDDMYVVEAPSFIVPYVYEKPPVTSLRDFIDEMGRTIKEQERDEKKKKKEKSESKEDEEKKGDKVEKSDTSEEKIEGKEDKAKEKVDGESAKDIEDVTEKIKSDTESDDDGKESDSSSKKDSDGVVIVEDSPKKKSDNYFENPLGKLFMQIGLNQVQEMVQTDLLRTQKRKRDKDEKNCPPEVHKAINSLIKTLEITRDANKAFKLELQKCNFCNFKTESTLVMAHHLETPHMRNYIYRCNFCTLEVRSPHDILFHMEAEHKVRGRLERAPAFHQCPNCPFEDNQKGKLSRHLLSCSKKYKPERNQEPPLDWEPPAKIPRIRGTRPAGIPGGPLYQAPLAPRGNVVLGRLPSPAGHSLLASRGRGRPPIYINRGGNMPIDGRSSPHHKQMGQIRPGIVFRPVGPSGQQVVVPSAYNNMYQVEKEPYSRPFPLPVAALIPNVATSHQKGSQAVSASAAAAGATAKLLQQPSISITPLPRQTGAPTPQNQPQAPYIPNPRPGRPPTSSAKTTFVICEICDGYIKDLEQLRNHMQWIHKVKIHPKMIYNRPPLNCQKCQFRFFTDQGLERHLLGTHGLVTSSMQEAANKGKDGGRCPVCGRVYQWKLLNHVARDHNMSLKPAHLSYKCTVCTATFGMYKQFESHVYSAHSVVSKRPNDKKPSQSTQPSTSSSSQPPLSESGDDVKDDDDDGDDESVGVVDDGKSRPLSKTGRQPVDIQSFTKTLQGLGTVITLKASSSSSSTGASVGDARALDEDGSSRQNRKKKDITEAKSRLKKRETRRSQGDNTAEPRGRVVRPDGKEQTGESMLKPLKINDEITIIPQPARAKTKTSQSSSSSNKPAKVIEF